MNTQLFQLINSLAGQNGWLDSVMVFSADRLGYVLVAGLAFYYFKNREKYREMFLVSLASAIIARFGVVSAIRYFYYSPRPFAVLESVNQLLSHEPESSFPSGHAAFYFALATGVFLYNKKIGYLYFALAGLMGFARVFGGVHWPLDILAGAVAGTLATLALFRLNKKLEYAKKRSYERS